MEWKYEIALKEEQEIYNEDQEHTRRAINIEDTQKCEIELVR